MRSSKPQCSKRGRGLAAFLTSGIRLEPERLAGTSPGHRPGYTRPPHCPALKGRQRGQAISRCRGWPYGILDSQGFALGWSLSALRAEEHGPRLFLSEPYPRFLASLALIRVFCVFRGQTFACLLRVLRASVVKSRSRIEIEGGRPPPPLREGQKKTEKNTKKIQSFGGFMRLRSWRHRKRARRGADARV